MNKLRAFIAHSFDAERDGDVVRIFLDYFGSLKDIFELEYDHAERAEAKAISQKVKDKMEDKNLFIGIFTAKNHRIEEGNLKTNLPIINYGKKHLFSEGSSDWIIQESGYALAKNMRLLFLVEKGVHVDAGLQGDTEFVEFKRENPSACFKKINEILGSLSIESMDTMSIPISASAPETKRSDIDKEQGSKDMSETKEELDGKKFSDAYLSLYRFIKKEKDLINAEKKLDEIIKEFESNVSFNSSYWKALFYKFKLDAGFPEALSELEKLREEYPDDIQPLTALGYTYKKYSKYSKAAEQFLKRSEKQKEMEDIIESIGTAAECYALDGKFNVAYDIILKEFTHDRLDMNSLYILYKKLAEVAKIQENKNLFMAFAEKALDIVPTDYDLRFHLAYSYSETGNNTNSLAHYKFLGERNPNGTNCNNLGCEYFKLDMKSKSIGSFKDAAEKYGETLAMANLASGYITEGFLTEAIDILKAARLKEPYHENVDREMERINEIRRKDEESLTKILKSIEPERKFIVKFAEAYALPSEVDITGKWNSRHGEISIIMDGNKIYGATEIKIKTINNLLATTRSRGVGGLIDETDSKKRIVISGEIKNRSIDFQLRIKTISSGVISTLLGDNGEQELIYNGLLYLSENAQIINVMEWEKNKHEIEFYEMNKLQ
jgi:hypothetical protein